MIAALASSLVGQVQGLAGAATAAATGVSNLFDTAQKSAQGKTHHGHGGGGFRSLSDELQSTLIQQQSSQAESAGGALRTDASGQSAANLG